MERLTESQASLAVSSGVPFLKSGGGGVIFSANPAFCELVQYNEIELKRIGWNKLSVDNEDLEADQELASQLIAGTLQRYEQWKAYRTRHGNPIPGQLTVIRYPQGTGPIECCLCWFLPLVNGSKAAVDMVTEYIRTHEKITLESTEAISKMLTYVDDTKKRSVMKRVFDLLGEAHDANPVKFWAVAIAILAVNSNLIISVAQQMNIIPAQPVKIQIDNETTGQVYIPDQSEICHLLGAL